MGVCRTTAAHRLVALYLAAQGGVLRVSAIKRPVEGWRNRLRHRSASDQRNKHNCCDDAHDPPLRQMNGWKRRQRGKRSGGDRQATLTARMMMQVAGVSLRDGQQGFIS